MKKTQRIDAKQNIRKQWVSFLSIIVIAAMAVTAYLGLDYSGRAIARNADRFFDSVRFRDAELISTLLLSPEDLEALRQTEGVADVEPVWQGTGMLSKGESSKNAAIVSLTERINVPQLLSGRLPEAEDECVVDLQLAENLGLTLGDTVCFSGAQYLLRDSFTVCGIAINADHANNELSTPGDRNVVVLPSVFDLEALDGCAMKALLRYSDCEGLSRFDKAYFAAAEDTVARIKALAAERPALRTENVLDEYGQQIAAGEAELADAEKELADARQQLDDGWTELSDGEQQAADAEKELTDAKAQLDEGQQQLADGEQQLADGRIQLWNAKAQLDEALAQLTDGQLQLDEAWAQLTDGRRQLDEGWAEYHESEAQLAEAKALLDDGRLQLEDGEQQLDEAWAQLVEAKAQLDDGERQYEAGGKELEAAVAELDAGGAALEAGGRQLADSWTQLEDGKAQAREALQDMLVIHLGDNSPAGNRNLPALGANMLPALGDPPGGDPGGDPGSDPGNDPGGDPGNDPGNDPGGNPGGDPGNDPGNDPGGDPGNDPGNDPGGIDIDLSALIVWADRNDGVDLDSGAVNATDFFISNSPEINLDLSQSLEDNIAGFLSDALDSSLDSMDPQEREKLEAWFGSAINSENRDAAIHAVVDAVVDAGLPDDVKDSYALLASGAKAWDDGYSEYLSGAASLRAGSYAYIQGLAKYVDARKQLDEGWAQYNEGLAQYEEGAALLAEKKAEYADGLAQYEDGVARLAEGLEQLQSGEAEYADSMARYDEAKAELDDGWTRYNDGLAQFNAAQAEYYTRYGEYADGLAQYNSGLAQYTQGTKDYADAMEALENGRAELTDGEARYAEGMAEYLQGALALSDAKAQLAGLDECRWVILDVNGNASYQVLKADVQNVFDLAMTFALIFILVGALVIYATLGKIVEEQRRLVGATRALGFYKKEILAKYLVFGMGATLLGMLLGVAIGYFLIQPMLTGGYGQFFNFDNSRSTFSPVSTLLVLAGGMALSALAVVLACTDLLRSTATSLMQEKAPSVKQRGRKSRGKSLYMQLILLNMRTDLKRVMVTIVSVAGCCTLLVTGFTMRNGIMAALDRRFEDILRFDCTAYFSEGAGEDAFSAAQSALEGAGASSAAVLTGSQLYSIDGQLNVNTLYCGDLEELRSFLHSVETGTGKALETEREGVWICNKVSEVTGLRAGDSIVLYDDSMHPYDAPVAGVFEDYMVQDMLMSRESYAHIFGAPPENNALLVKAGSLETDALEQLLGTLPEVARIQSNAQDRATMTDIAGVLDLVSLLLVGLAAIMACFIILNLINMQVTQKKRELTIMRVNGFTVRETIGYILREAVVTNILGIVLGLGTGMLLAYIILLLMEGVTARFVRTPQPVALILAVLLTAGFSVILNAIALRKVKYLKLTDVT